MIATLILALWMVFVLGILCGVELAYYLNRDTLFPSFRKKPKKS